jgi:arginase
MNRSIAVVGAPSSIGIRPYDDGEARHLDRAPGVLRRRDLVSRLGALDFGDVMPPPYRDYAKPLERARNEREVAAYSRSLAERVIAATRSGRFAVVLGGDCSIVLGCLLAARRRAGGPVGLAYLDAHADFATAQESATGSVSGMSLALASGRGESLLASLAGPTPLVNDGRVVMLGRRSDASGSGRAALEASSILEVPISSCNQKRSGELAAATLERVASPDVRGFWIHLDADVINPAMMPAVDSPEPGGPTLEDLVEVLAPLVDHPLALGLDLSIYDPALDPDRSCARRLVGLLEALTRAHRT